MTESPPPFPTGSRFARFKHRLTTDPRAPAAFFLVGFAFDYVLLDRPDSLFQIIGQIVYFLLLTPLLWAILLHDHGLLRVPPRLEKYWGYRDLAAQFLFGSLLNVYTFFYLKSSSLFASLIFVLLIAGLLLANEFVRLKTRQTILKLVLYFLCVVSFWIYVIPMLLGFIGVVAFVLALTISAGAVATVYRLAERSTRNAGNGPAIVGAFRKQIFGTGFGVIAAFAFFYVFNLIPPVPLSLSYIGVFHGVRKEAGHYYLTQTRSRWLFWQNGDQSFYARPGDSIVTFVRVFAPRGFRDQLQVRWLLKTPRGWEKQDLIPITIAGGRDEGFRGYTTKANYQPGDYRVQIETTDGREIGRISLTVETDPGITERESVEIRQ